MAIQLDTNLLCNGRWACTLFLITSCFVVAILFISLLVLYPFYVTSFWKNRERDRTANSSIFYILQHFFRVVNFMELCFFVNIVCLWIGFRSMYDTPSTTTIVAYVTIFISFIIILSITMMENVMLSALAIHRFLLYFFPSTEKYLAASLKTLSATVTSLYIIVFVVNFIDRFIKIMLISEKFQKTGELVYEGNYEMDKFDTFNQRIYFGSILFLFLSASLYIPMMVSIRKMSKLQSAKKSQPEKYILYQTLFLIVLRLLYIPVLYFMFASLSQFNEGLLFVGMICVDICITHFIIQASYLSCNKKHVESIYKSCSKKRNVVADVDTDATETAVHSRAVKTMTHSVGTSTDD